MKYLVGVYKEKKEWLDGKFASRYIEGVNRIHNLAELNDLQNNYRDFNALKTDMGYVCNSATKIKRDVGVILKGDKDNFNDFLEAIELAKTRQSTLGQENQRDSGRAKCNAYKIQKMGLMERLWLTYVSS